MLVELIMALNFFLHCYEQFMLTLLSCDRFSFSDFASVFPSVSFFLKLYDLLIIRTNLLIY